VHGITVPAAIFAGARDKVFAALAEQLHNLIPNSMLHIYENTGHMLNLEQSMSFNTDLKVLLEGIAG